MILVFQAHLYHLMKSDSYSRYLRSEMYKEFLSGNRKKVILSIYLAFLLFPLLNTAYAESLHYNIFKLLYLEYNKCQ